jgi:PPOX class probable F420-dependent enzyme
MLADAPRHHSTVALTTFRRDGSEAESLVSVAVTGDGRAVFRTYAETWKARRLRRDPRVRVTPTTFRGRPVAPGMAARARRLEGQDAAAARRAAWRRRAGGPPSPRAAHAALRVAARGGGRRMRGKGSESGRRTPTG